MNRRTRKKSLVYGVPFFTALFVRVVLFFNYWGSPFPYYSSVNGLDTRTLVENGLRFYQQKTTFTLYKLLVATAQLLSGGHHHIEYIIAIQYALGCLTAVLTAHVVWKFYRKPWLASIAGLLAAVYAPAAFYESFTLKESLFTFVAFFSFCSILLAKKHHFRSLYTVVATLSLLLPFFIRPSALLWTVVGTCWLFYSAYSYFIKRPGSASSTFKKFIAGYVITVVLTMLVVLAVNYHHQGRLYPYNNNLKSYYLKLGTYHLPTSMSISRETGNGTISRQKSQPSILKRLLTMSGTYAYKFFAIFHSFEVTNNLNYYFVTPQLPPLDVLPGALLINPMALCAIVIALATKKWLTKEGMLLLFLFSFMLPILLFVPLGRLRLVLYPAFICLDCFFILQMISFYHRESKVVFLVSLLALTVITYLFVPSNIRTRADDYYIHGKALEKQGAPHLEVEKHFAYAYRLKPKLKYGLNLAFFYQKSQQPKQEIQILWELQQRYRNDYRLKLHLVGLLFSIGNCEEAIQLLKAPPLPKSRSDKHFYSFYQGEYHRIKKEKKKALLWYTKALENATSQQQESMVKQRISLIKSDF